MSLGRDRMVRSIQKTLCTQGYAPFASTGINSYINFYAPMKSFINMGGAFQTQALGTIHLPQFTQRKVSNEPPKPP